jgi:hypothetical protein
MPAASRQQFIRTVKETLMDHVIVEFFVRVMLIILTGGAVGG